jgi:hypothetical protein
MPGSRARRGRRRRGRREGGRKGREGKERSLGRPRLLRVGRRN